MKYGMFASAALLVAGFFAVEAPAQEVIKSQGTVVTGSEVRMAPMGRSGLFSRLRNRGMTTNNAPMMMTTTAPATIVPASATNPATQITPIATTPQVVEQRQGLGARLRARLGRG